MRWRVLSRSLQLSDGLAQLARLVLGISRTLTRLEQAPSIGAIEHPKRNGRYQTTISIAVGSFIDDDHIRPRVSIERRRASHGCRLELAAATSPATATRRCHRDN